MNVESFRNQLYRILTYSNKLQIASIEVDAHTDDKIYIELLDGDKFEISIRTTERII